MLYTGPTSRLNRPPNRRHWNVRIDLHPAVAFIVRTHRQDHSLFRLGESLSACSPQEQPQSNSHLRGLPGASSNSAPLDAKNRAIPLPNLSAASWPNRGSSPLWVSSTPRPRRGWGKVLSFEVDWLGSRGRDQRWRQATIVLGRPPTPGPSSAPSISLVAGPRFLRHRPGRRPRSTSRSVGLR